MQWLTLFELDKKAHRLLSTLAAGEQRLALLGARPHQKPAHADPRDEPRQGLDQDHYRALP